MTSLLSSIVRIGCFVDQRIKLSCRTQSKLRQPKTNDSCSQLPLFYRRKVLHENYPTTIIFLCKSRSSNSLHVTRPKCHHQIPLRVATFLQWFFVYKHKPPLRFLTALTANTKPLETQFPIIGRGIRCFRIGAEEEAPNRGGVRKKMLTRNSIPTFSATKQAPTCCLCLLIFTFPLAHSASVNAHQSADRIATNAPFRTPWPTAIVAGNRARNSCTS